MKKVLSSGVLLLTFCLMQQVSSKNSAANYKKDSAANCKKDIATCFPALLREASVAVGLQNDAQKTNRWSCAKYPAAFAYNIIDQQVGGGDYVQFNHSLTADACAIVPPNSEDYFDACNDGSTFMIKKSGWYHFSYEIRGRRRFNISPLIFELTASDCESTWSIHGSRHASQPVVGNGKSVVNGSLMAYINVPSRSVNDERVEEKASKSTNNSDKTTKSGWSSIKVRLHNITNSSSSAVFLNNDSGDENCVVNASLLIERLPDQEWILDLVNTNTVP